MSKSVNELLNEGSKQLMEDCMKDVTIKLCDVTKNLVTEADVEHMLKAAEVRVLVTELDMNVPRLRELLRRARAAESKKNRTVQQWEAIAERMCLKD